MGGFSPAYSVCTTAVQRRLTLRYGDDGMLTDTLLFQSRLLHSCVD
jgi:hypothetical protein